VAAGSREAAFVAIHSDDPACWDCLRQPQRDGPLAASTIEHHHVGPEEREQKVRVGVDATRLDRCLRLAPRLRSSHCAPMAEKVVNGRQALALAIDLSFAARIISRLGG
jgi:hypothetical protein